METPHTGLARRDLVDHWLVAGDMDERVRTMQAQPMGGCNACRFADPLSDRLCTLVDISAEDFDLGVSGLNCSRFVPYETSLTIGKLQHG